MRQPTTLRPSSRLQVELRLSLDDARCPGRPGDEASLARVKQRVLAAVTERSEALHGTVRADAGVWEPVAPGIERKLP